MNTMHMKFFCKWCGRQVAGCRQSCAGPHSHEEVESCATCAHRPSDELRAIEQMPDDPEATHALLAMVMEDPPSLATVEAWMPGQRRAAEEWAGTEEWADELRMERLKVPAFLREEVYA